MAAYNTAPYIDEAIQSVLSQEGVSFELLIGDDASTDGTWTRVHGYAADPRVRVWRFRQHQKVGEVRNFLISKARGVYLSICDSDDIMLPDNLCRLSKFLDRQPKIGLVCGDMLITDELAEGFSEPLLYLGPSKGWDLVEMVVPHGGSMIRASLFRGVGGYRSDLTPVDDYDLFLRLAEVTKFLKLNRVPTYLYRLRSNSLYHGTPLSKCFELMWKARLDAALRRYGPSRILSKSKGIRGMSCMSYDSSYAGA